MSTVRFSISLPQEIYQKLKQDAAANDRTLAAQVRHILRRHYGNDAPGKREAQQEAKKGEE